MKHVVDVIDSHKVSDDDIQTVQDCMKEGRFKDLPEPFGLKAQTTTKFTMEISIVRKDDTHHIVKHLIFEEKIKTIDPRRWFPDYTGGCDKDKCEAFFRAKFKERMQRAKNKSALYVHTT